MVTATMYVCHCVILKTHTVTWTQTPHILFACMPLWLGGCTQSQSHRRTTLCDSVDTSCERVRDCDYVIASTHTVSVTPIAVLL